MSVSMKQQILDVVAFLRERGEETTYGYGDPAEPREFTPDPECSTEEERERHRLACEAWDRGEPLDVTGPFTTWKSREEAEAYVRSCMERGAAAATIRDPGPGEIMRWSVHCHVGGWGLGTYTIRDPELMHAADTLERIAADMPGDVE